MDKNDDLLQYSDMLKTLFNLKKKNNKKEVDKVYEFFVSGKSKDRKHVYDCALRMAQNDQLTILKKAEMIKN